MKQQNTVKSPLFTRNTLTPFLWSEKKNIYQLTGIKCQNWVFFVGIYTKKNHMLHNIHRYLFVIKSAVIVRHLYFVNKKGLLELFCLKINTIEALTHPIDIIL